MDNNSTLYYSLLTTNSIARWNTQLSFQTGQQVIARDPNYLEWPNSFTFDQTGNITVLVNKLNKFIYDKLELNQVNFRLITSKVGGKSYLYDQTYDYTSDNNQASTSPPTTEINATVTSDLAAPEIFRPGSDQDPYLAPRPVPKQSTHEPLPEPEPTAEPVPEPTPPQPNDLLPNHMGHDDMNHDHMNHDHMDHDHMNQGQNMDQVAKPSSTEKAVGGASKIIGSFIGIIVASALFLV